MLNTSSMQGRRYHRKSRNGCMQCKKRKVKCDERKPKCEKCEVYGVPCTYATGSTTKTTSISQRTSPESSAEGWAQKTSEEISRVESGPGSTILSTLPLFTLELLHHWTTETSRTLSAEPEVQKMWREQAPKVGFTTPFVMHSILAVSALHLYRLCSADRRQECLDQARTHHMAAMQVVAPNISDLMEEQGASVILFSWLTCIYSCGRPHTQNDSLILGESGTPEWLTYLRGNKVVLESSRDMFRHGVLAPVFNNGARHSYVRRNTPAIDGEQYVWRVRDFIMEHVSNPADREMYIKAVDLLSQSYAFTMADVSRASDTTVVMPWLFEIPDGFVDCLQQKSPPALIIFAYFCVLVKELDWMWWLEGLSHKFMGELFNALDPEYREWLRWPSEAIGWTRFDDWYAK